MDGMTPGEAALTDAMRRVRASTARLTQADAEDITQEAVVRALHHGVDPEAEAWLRTVARRIAIDRHRRRREFPSGTATDVERLHAPAGAGPEDAVLRAESRDELRQALAALPDVYRHALEIYLDADLCPREVGRRLDKTPNATWTLLSRARSRLRVELERMGYVPALLWGRLARRQDHLAWTGTALGAAVIFSLGAPPASPAAEMAPPVTEVAVEAASVAPIEAAVAGAAAAPAPASARAVGRIAPPEPNEPVRVDAGACLPNEDRTEVALSLWFEDDDGESLSDTVVAAMPEPVRKERASGC